MHDDSTVTSHPAKHLVQTATSDDQKIIMAEYNLFCMVTETSTMSRTCDPLQGETHTEVDQIAVSLEFGRANRLAI